MNDDDDLSRPVTPLRPGKVSVEHAIFVALGMAATLLVLYQLYVLFTG